ncbi:hypothetical protein Fleli_1071 [Bernardetia litoralis DSM 6794]|uniref:Secretion system C-terminal sorting domain-containing protein n=1 Tax=Bernardetia litoralis (strain ATCC 23117 / DSM 6794 / NBRC 15988 / NCIMB 1366 / Fx l1 / Sio-4) TaxID=880071 RepID=I4AHS4_BERLS|nr:T9SS type A sorting domain-containing protein [Bernardetia litoralis]AFM03509.1 hypothetical protein Fleli_1071 [Bernardetia litoralis DSM 6794]
MNHSSTRLFHKKYWLLILLFFSSISFSWGQFGYTQTESNDCQANTSIADIDVSIMGSSYTWSNGASTQNISDVSNGYYTLTIDGSTVLPVIVGVPVQWKNLVTSTDATNGQLQASQIRDWTNPAGGHSIGKLGSNQTGGFTYVVDNLSTASNLMVGLSTPNTSAKFTSIRNSFFVSSDNKLVVYWNNGANSLATDITVTTNDRLTMVRSGSNINYYHNTTLVYTDNTATPTDELVVDMSIIEGTSPTIWFSVCTPSINYVTYLQTLFDDCTTGASEGSVTLTPQDGSGSYTYTGGATVANPTGLTNGLLQVTVNDGFAFTTVPVVVGNPIIWDNLSNASQSQGKLFARNSSTIDNAGAFSSAALAASTDGGITYTHNENFRYYMVGLSTTDASASWSSLQYSLLLSQDNIYIYESGVLVGTYPDLSNGDRLTIVREGSEIAYYRNNVLLKRSVVSSSVELFADATIWGDETPVIYSSFCTSTLSTLGLTYTQTTFDDCNTAPGEGIVSLQGVGGTAAYSYTWNNASTANPRSTLEKGLYTVTLESGTASVTNSPIVVGGIVDWTTLSNASQGGGTLTATTDTDWNTPAGGFSSNQLPSNTDGGITYLISTLDRGNYQIGLSTTGADASTWESQGYSVWIGIQNRIVIYESGTEIGDFASVNAGDRISIIRRGSNIEYYLNSTLIRTSATTAAQPLFADISVIEGTSPAVYASFCSNLSDLVVSYTQTVVDDCATAGTGEGEITVNASGAAGGYVYGWTGNNGAAATATRTTLSRGVDELTVTSGASSITTPVISGALVNWTSVSVGASTSNGTVTSATNDNLYSGEPAESGALSTNVLPNGVNGGITFIIPSVLAADVDKYMIGLSPSTAASPEWENLKYSVYLNPSTLNVDVYESGNLQTSTSVSLAANDRITIVKKGTSMEYYHNNTLIRTSTGIDAEDLYADITVISGTSPAVYASFCNTGLRVGESTVDGGNTSVKKVVATNDISAQTLFAYPNPSSGKVTVRLADQEIKGNVAIRVIDVLGRTILTQNSEKQSSTLEISFDLINQKAGIYFVEITSENQTQRIKIVKE